MLSTFPKDAIQHPPQNSPISFRTIRSCPKKSIRALRLQRSGSRNTRFPLKNVPMNMKSTAVLRWQLRPAALTTITSSRRSSWKTKTPSRLSSRCTATAKFPPKISPVRSAPSTFLRVSPNRRSAIRGTLWGVRAHLALKTHARLCGVFDS